MVPQLDLTIGSSPQLSPELDPMAGSSCGTIQTRTGCHAQSRIELNRKKNNFFVNYFVESHNHLLVMQECAHMLPSQHKITLSQAVEVDLTKQSGIPLKSTFELMGKQAGGRESLGYTKIDHKTI